jgi:hypothetical protein
MAFFIIIVVLFALLGLAALITGHVLYFQFCHSPEKRWRDEVLGLVADGQRHVRTEDQQLRQLRADEEATSCSAQGEAFLSYLSETPIGELEAYPGIGPGTVGKLREAGYRNLAALHRARIQIHGLGEKRMADIDYAVRDLVRKARATFDAGACPQARWLAQELNEITAKYDGRQASARARSKAARHFIDELEDHMRAAQEVTFWRWLRPISEKHVVPPHLLEADLPNLDAALRAADVPVAKVQIDDLPIALPVDPASTERKAVQRVGVLKSVASAPHNVMPTAKLAVQPKGYEERQMSSAGQNAKGNVPDDAHLRLMELHIQLALRVARADGPVKAAERELILGDLRKRFSYNQALHNRAEALYAHYESAPIDLEMCLLRINQLFSAPHRSALMQFAAQIVAVSAKVTSAEMTFLKSLAERLKVAPVALPLAAAEVNPVLMPAVPAIAGVRAAGSQQSPTPSATPPAAQGEREPLPAWLRDNMNKSRNPPAVSPASSAPVPANALPTVPVVVPPATRSSSPSKPQQTPQALSSVLKPAGPIQPQAAAPNCAPALTRDQCIALLEIQSSSPISADLVRRQWNLLNERYALVKLAKLGPEFVKEAQAKLADLRKAATTLLETMGEKPEISTQAPTSSDMRHNPDLDDVFGI